MSGPANWLKPGLRLSWQRNEEHQMQMNSTIEIATERGHSPRPVAQHGERVRERGFFKTCHLSPALSPNFVGGEGDHIEHWSENVGAPQFSRSAKFLHSIGDRKSTRLNSSHLGISYA